MNQIMLKNLNHLYGTNGLYEKISNFLIDSKHKTKKDLISKPTYKKICDFI
jgi:hypothetical protein